MSNNERFSYPEELEPQFVETTDINFRDGTSVSASEVWKFMTQEAPRRFPYNFDNNVNYRRRISDDVEFLSGIKRGYLNLTLKDRLLKAHNSGVPLIHIQSGQSMDPYYAAGGIPLRPGKFIMSLATNMQEGLSLEEADIRRYNIREIGRKKISIDACNMIDSQVAISDGIVPVDLIAPYLALRCPDMAYLVESHRHDKIKIPLFLVDYPIEQENKEWCVNYLEALLHTLTKKISKLSGKETTDKDVREEIRLENKGRQLVRDIVELWWSARVPPLNGTDFSISSLAVDFEGDPVATVGVLEEMKKEVKERVKHSVKGKGLVDDPKRLYICGSCVNPNHRFIEKVGAVRVGGDDQWSTASTEVKENGDPYENLARATLSYPMEQPTEKRAEWIVEQVKKSRADGFLFMFNWGCNYQAAVARMVSDIVKEKTGLPTTIVELGERGRMKAIEQSQNRIESFIEMLN